MQGEVLGRILQDQEGVLAVGHVIVTALADRDALVEVIATIKPLAQFQQVAVAGEPDAELLAHGACAAIAAGEIARADGRGGAAGAHARRHLVRRFDKVEKFGAVANRDARERLGDRFEERLQRVLRNELIGLERHLVVGRSRDQPLGFGDRRVRMVHQRRIDDRRDDKDVHRAVRRQPHRANAVGKTHATVDLHRARVAPLHLRQKLRRVLLLDERAAHPAHAEIDGERQPRRAPADNENIGINHAKPLKR